MLLHFGDIPSVCTIGSGGVVFHRPRVKSGRRSALPLRHRLHRQADQALSAAAS